MTETLFRCLPPCFPGKDFMAQLPTSHKHYSEIFKWSSKCGQSHHETQVVNFKLNVHLLVLLLSFILVWHFFDCSLNRSFYVNIENSNSYVYCNSFMEFLKDPSLVLYSSYCTPLVSVLSSTPHIVHHSSQYCHLIQQQTITTMLMNDAQLLFSFSAVDFSNSVTHLENTNGVSHSRIQINELVFDKQQFET